MTTDTRAITPAARPSGRLLWLAGGALVLAVVLAYANTWRVPFVLDDGPSIIDNPTLSSWSAAWRPPADSGLTVSGRPLLNLSLALNHALGGENVVGYHVVNVGLHALAALALFGLARALLSMPRLAGWCGRAPVAAAWVIAWVWSLHPLHTESVTYVIQRAESLMGLLYLATLWAFLRAATAEGRAVKGWGTAAVVFCALGMAAKEVMVSAPLAVLVLDRLALAGSWGEVWRRRGRLHAALLATWLVLVWCMATSGNRGGAVGFGSAIGSWDYLLTQCWAVVRYLRLVAWPAPLVFDYGVPVYRALGDVVVEALVLLGLLGAAVWSLRRWPLVGWAGLMFFVVLAPSSSVVPLVNQTAAEHRMYLASVFVVALLAAGLWRVAGRASLALGVAWGLGLGVATHLRNDDYRSAVTLWRDTAQKAPDNARAWYALGIQENLTGNAAGAVAALERARRLAPENGEIMIALANALGGTGRSGEAVTLYREGVARVPDSAAAAYEGRQNLGVLLAARGELDAALAELRLAVRLRPKEAAAYLTLGNLLSRAERGDEAVTVLTEGVGQLPQSAELHAALGLALAMSGRTEAGLREVDRALALDPANGAAAKTGGLIRLSQGDLSAAVRWLTVAAQAEPGNGAVQSALAEALLGIGRVQEALDAYAAAITATPEDAPTRYAYAHALLKANKVEAAVAHYLALLRLDPQMPEGHNELGVAYAQLGRFDEAKRQFQEALRLRNNFPPARENLSRLPPAFR